MATEIDAFVARLRGATQLDEPLLHIKKWAEAGATRELVSCWTAVEAACDAKALALLAAEREAPTYMPMYGEGAIDRAVARLEGGPTSARTIPPPGEGDTPRATRVVDDAADARLAAAFGPWTEDSNGEIEAGVFT